MVECEGKIIALTFCKFIDIPQLTKNIKCRKPYLRLMYLLVGGLFILYGSKTIDTSKEKFHAFSECSSIAILCHIQATVHTIDFQHSSVTREFHQTVVCCSPYLAIHSFCKGMDGIVGQSVGGT